VGVVWGIGWNTSPSLHNESIFGQSEFVSYSEELEASTHSDFQCWESENCWSIGSPDATGLDSLDYLVGVTIGIAAGQGRKWV
jgi:hypothetical protein